jgi:hypothetical protein
VLWAKTSIKKRCIKTTFYQSNKISAFNFVKLLFENRKNAKNEEKKNDF